MKEIICVENLSKRYAGNHQYSVENLSLAVREGEIFGLLGPNGAGKTTLISLLCGMTRPTSGSVRIRGLNYRDHRSRIQQMIGMVPQEYALYPTLTARENLQYFGGVYGISTSVLKGRISEGLEMAGLSAFKDRQIHTFSGGMKRRINLLAGILHQPEILFLDEPTVGVDVQSREVILQMLERLNSQGTTIIYTSHHLDEAQQFCTRIIIIDHGRVLADGTPEQIIDSVDNAQTLERVFIHLTGRKLRDYA